MVARCAPPHPASLPGRDRRTPRAGDPRHAEPVLTKVQRDVLALGGVASMRELAALGHWREWVRIAERYGRLTRVRIGWYAVPGEPAQVIRAWRVGGRLACRSALAYHDGVDHPGSDGFLHVEVAANASRLRSPDDLRRRLTDDDAVVLHWRRREASRGRRAVTADEAAADAATCGAPYSLRQGSSPAAPPSGLSPPRRR